MTTLLTTVGLEILRTKTHQHQIKFKFMRKGIVGDWKNFLSAEQSAEMDTICVNRLRDTGLEFQYELNRKN